MRDSSDPRVKLLGWDELAERLEAARKSGRRIVFTNGCFDLLHVGHTRTLRQARALGDLLVVGINTDASVRRLKGEGRPLVPEAERAELIASLACVGYVTLFDEATPEALLSRLRPEIHVKGGDYQEELPETPLVRSWGGRVVILPFTPGRSTTELAERLRSCPIRAVGVIPSRYAATRLPGKPLLPIDGKPMIQHVYERARAARALDRVIVATDDERILEAVRNFGGEGVLTSPHHRSGTDRVAEVARNLNAEVVINVQGDEPMLDAAGLDALVAAFERRPDLEIATLAHPITRPEDVGDPAAVKVVVDRDGFALYFSRLPIPFYRDGRETGGPLPGVHWRHLGVYAYRKPALLRFAALEPTPLEAAEALEQLRALENGMRILVLPTEQEAIGVDTPEDLERVRRLLARD